ncbi:hypothetical protein U1Q18_021391, partial [Sarracenia purpurea var. burkii]
KASTPAVSPPCSGLSPAAHRCSSLSSVAIAGDKGETPAVETKPAIRNPSLSCFGSVKKSKGKAKQNSNGRLEKKRRLGEEM